MQKLFLIILFTAVILFAGENNSGHTNTEAYKIPFASIGNEIELTVSNSSAITQNDVKVKIINTPAWVKFSQNEITINELKGNKENDVIFSFSLDKKAPVGEETTLSFIITNKDGSLWTKDIKIKVSAPEKFELFRNYPNPFNPVTTISYQLSVESKVQLKIYNMLGQEVSTLVSSTQAPGYYPMSWNASNYSSGMYIYQIDAQGTDGQRHIERNKMMLLK